MLLNTQIYVFNGEWVKNYLVTALITKREQNTEPTGNKTLDEILIKRVNAMGGKVLVLRTPRPHGTPVRLSY